MIIKVMAGRSGKVSVYTSRMKGIGRKALSRRKSKCPLDQDHKAAAESSFLAATTIEEVRLSLQSVLAARTTEIPPCRNIQTMIGRKVNKIANRMKKQTRA